MEELILIALIVGAGYFLLIQQKKSTNNQSPITQSQSTQTEPLAKPINDNKALEKTLATLLQNIRKLNQKIK